MSHPHSQAGFWAGIPAGGKLVFGGVNKHYGCLIPVWGGGGVEGSCLFDFRKLTSALWLFF